MRLWSIHPKYLDAAGLVALWREALLAKKVLEGNTKGYKNHPQLVRFSSTSDPAAAINAYLAGVYEESSARGYNFNISKTGMKSHIKQIDVTSGQLQYEWRHLLNKLKRRSPELAANHADIKNPEPHPLFAETPGDVESWEKRGSVISQLPCLKA